MQIYRQTSDFFPKKYLFTKKIIFFLEKNLEFKKNLKSNVFNKKKLYLIDYV